LFIRCTFLLFFVMFHPPPLSTLFPYTTLFRSIAGGIASALAGGAMSKLFGGGFQGDVLATDNNTVGMGDAGIKSAIQGSNVPNPDRKSGSAGMPRPISYAVFCLKKKKDLIS